MTVKPLVTDSQLNKERGRRSIVERVVREATRTPDFTEWAVIKSRPKMEFEQGIYRVVWDEPFVMLEFDYLSSSRSSGDIHAEITVVVDSPAKGHYQKTRLNLLADRSVSSFASSLDKRLPHLKIPWGDWLNDAVQWVLAQYRSGEPAVILTEAPMPEGDGSSLLSPFLASDGMTIVFGDGGAGKSQLALAIAASLHAGIDVIPGFHPSRQVNVAFLDWEWSAWKHRQRLEKLWAEFDGTPPGIVYVPCRLSLRDERDRIRRIIRDHNIGYLVMDSLGMAAGGAPEEAETAIGFFGALRELGLPSVGVAHVNRADAKGSADKPFGSAYWHNTARSTWYVKKSDQETVDGSVPLALFHRKSNEDRLHQPIGLQVHFDEDVTRYVVSKTALEETDLASQLSVPKQITLYLRGPEGAKTVHQIAEAIGADVDTVRKSLQRGAGKQFVKRDGGTGEPATWALVSHA